MADGVKRAVAEALERKRRLGHYAVIWREGHVVCTGPDAPVVLGVPSTGKTRDLVSTSSNALPSRRRIAAK